MLTLALSLLVGVALGAGVVLVIWYLDRQPLVVAAARLEAERDAANARREDLAASQVQLREAFTALSRSALHENRNDFLRDARSVMDPVKETLGRVQQQLSDVDKAREGSYRAVSSQLGLLQQAQEQLRATAEGLSRSLGSPNVRGTWGEVQLRRIVELAGMLPHCDFVEKASTTSSETGGRLTPDLIIRLPGNGSVVVDSKVPIQAYLDASKALDAPSRDQSLNAHVRQVRDHIRALGAKEYWRQFQPTPELVVMFLPLEALLTAAFERDETLFDLAAGLRVIPATPMTLLALLKTIASGWRQHQLARNADEIHGLGRELYERLATMVEHLESVGKNIKQAGDSYDRFVGSLEQKVLPGVRRFKELGVSSSKDLPALDPLRVNVRAVVKPELTGEPDTAPIDDALPAEKGD